MYILCTSNENDDVEGIFIQCVHVINMHIYGDVENMFVYCVQINKNYKSNNSEIIYSTAFMLFTVIFYYSYIIWSVSWV